MNHRLYWLDLIRGLAAIGVVLYHYHDVLGGTHGFYGYIAVDVFFVLSGIVLGLRYMEAIRNGLSLRAFALARVRRLYPMVFIAGLFVLLLALLHGAGALSDFSNWSVFLVLPAFTPAGALAFPADGPEWSLFAELVANAIWFAALRAGRHVWALLGVVAMAATAALAWKAGSMDFGANAGVASIGAGVVRAFAWFAVGCGIAGGHFRRRLSPRALAAGLAIVTFAAAALLHRTWLTQLLAIATFAAVLQMLALAPPPGVRLARVARRLGEASFPMYMIHLPAKTLLPLLGGLPVWLAMVLVVGGATVIVTWLNERLVALVQPRRRRVEVSVA